MKALLLSLLLFVTSAFAATETVEMAQVTPEIQLETTVFKPDGPGPFPLVVMNHGKAPIAARKHERIRYARFASEFLKRGYAVVLPMREGFSKSGGQYGDGDCNQALTGTLQARSIKMTLDYYSQQSWVDPKRIIIAGQSFGGLATMAFTADGYPGVRGTINFSGGLKYTYGCSDWAEQLIVAAWKYGLTAKTPSIWFYGRTDSYFPTEFGKKMADAYVSNGAPLIFTGPKCSYNSDSHFMLGWSDGAACYWPELERFLTSLGMPATDLETHEELPKPD